VEFDLIIRGATVYPGEGSRRRAGVGVADRRIAAVEASLDGSGAGEAVWRDGAATGARPARVVREPR
jgi:dihydroorotase-like cyclic amidohydrolase